MACPLVLSVLAYIAWGCPRSAAVRHMVSTLVISLRSASVKASKEDSPRFTRRRSTKYLAAQDDTGGGKGGMWNRKKRGVKKGEDTKEHIRVR